MGHTLSDNRHGLIANAMVTPADRHAEREAAKLVIQAACEAADDGVISITLGADKVYDATEFIDACQDLGVISHAAQNKLGRRSAVSDVIAASEGYAAQHSQAYGEPVDAASLIPHMLEAFMARDRAFSRGAGKRPPPQTTTGHAAAGS